MRTARVSIAFSLVLLAILACNAPTGQPDLAATITAQAAALQSSTPAAIIPVTGDTGTPSGTEVSVTAPTNCRTGPSTAYDLVFTANPGPSFKVVGKNSSTGYWIITNPAGGSCWLWGQNAVVTGDTTGLPEFPPPPPPVAAVKPTKTPKPTAAPTNPPSGTLVHPIFPVKPIASLVLFLPPNAPGNLTQNRSCSEFFEGLIPKWSEDVYLTWQDSSNETGYRVYKNGSALPDLAANVTSFHIQLRYDVGTGGALFDNFGVEAFNNAGTSGRPALDVPRCP